MPISVSFVLCLLLLHVSFQIPSSVGSVCSIRTFSVVPTLGTLQMVTEWFRMPFCLESRESPLTETGKEPSRNISHLELQFFDLQQNCKDDVVGLILDTEAI